MLANKSFSCSELLFCQWQAVLSDFDFFLHAHMKTQMNPRKVAKQMSYSQSPAWKLMKADFEIDYTDTKKEESSHFR